MILLLDIGNTNTHVGLADFHGVAKLGHLRTKSWFSQSFPLPLRRFVGRHRLHGAALCSVVPRATPLVRRAVARLWDLACVEVGPATIPEIGIDYPRPKTIGPDRLANAVAAHHRFGAPVVAIDFGTAVTFDVVDRSANFIGGIIAPGLAALTDYLHEKTALLPRIQLREIERTVGKSTTEAMLVGVIHGYRGLVRELIGRLRKELKADRLPVVATGGDGEFMASQLPEITAVDPRLTLEGVRLVWEARSGEGHGPPKPLYRSGRDAFCRHDHLPKAR